MSEQEGKRRSRKPRILLDWPSFFWFFVIMAGVRGGAIVSFLDNELVRDDSPPPGFFALLLL